MKTRTMMAVLLAAATLFASCNKEGNEAPGVPEGESTYLSITFTQPKAPLGRATNDANATLKEAVVKTLDVYIYSGTTMVKHENLDDSKFTYDDTNLTQDIWKVTTNIATTTGEKTVFLGVNLPSALATSLESFSPAEFASAAQTLSMDQLVQSDRLMMFSTAAATQTLVKVGDSGYDTNNSFTIGVKRLVAKVTLEEAAGGIQGKGSPGKFGNFMFAVNNMNKQLFLLPTADRKDPNYETADWVNTDFYDAVDDFGQPTDEYAAINANNEAIATRTAFYAPENTSKLHWKREITRATLRATFIPQEIYEEDGGTPGQFNKVTNPNYGSNTVATFWTIATGGEVYYFAVKTEAEAFADEQSILRTEIVEYENGLCYWDVFLNPRGVVGSTVTAGKEYDVFRNDYYRCTIKSVLAPGRPGPDVVPPTEPPAMATDIEVEVDILFWNAVSDEYDLEP